MIKRLLAISLLMIFYSSGLNSEGIPRGGTAQRQTLIGQPGSLSEEILSGFYTAASPITITGNEIWIDESSLSIPNITQITTRPWTSLTGNNWKAIYTNGSGTPTEFALGAKQHFYGGNGTSSAPTMQIPFSIFHVDGYGAGSGESAATNQTAFQNAINAAEVSGGVVMVGPFQYDLNDQLSIDSNNVRIIGWGREISKLRWTSDVDDDLISFDSGGEISNVGVQGLSISASTAQGADTAIYFYKAARALIRDIKISGSQIHDGIWFNGVDNSILDKFMISNLDGMGIIANGYGAHQSELRITSGRVYGCDESGIRIGGGIGGVYISNVDSNTNAWGLYQDNSFGGNADAGANNREIIVVNSALDSNDSAGCIMNSAMPNGTMMFSNVFFASNHTYGLQIDNTANNNVSISLVGCKFFNHLDDDGNAADHGIYVGDGEPYISIAGSTFANNDGYGIINPSASERIYNGAGNAWYSNGSGSIDSYPTNHVIYGGLYVRGTVGASNIDTTSGVEVFSFAAGGEIDNDVVFTGTVTTGGSDPPYEIFWAETRESVIERIKNNVPPKYLSGAGLFFNKNTNMLEIIRPDEGKIYSLTGQLLDTIDPITVNDNFEKRYSVNKKTGEVISSYKYVGTKYKIKDGYELDYKTGNFREIKNKTNIITKEKALELEAR